MSDAMHTARPVVLVALDGSPAAMTALPVARTVAAQIGAEVEILYIAAGPLPESDLRKQLGLDRVDTGVLGIRSMPGDPAAEIVRASEDPEVALVVLTTHGHAGGAGRRLGRVAESVIATSARPLLLVDPERASISAAGSPALRRLLLPLDGTPATAMALGLATELARQLGASIDVLYIADRAQAVPTEPGSISGPRYVDQPQHEWPHWAREVMDRLCHACAACPPDVPVRVALACGSIATEIIAFAAHHQHDAIVLVRRSGLESGRAQVLRAVIAQAPCPVLIVGGHASR